ncbi:MAG: RNA polymerase sigma factor [Anaerolineales bacterium]|nr:RNA polymerase sigma factor [Anaerolineales bacterium]
MDDLSHLTDTELISLCLARSSKDERPFAEIFHRHHAIVARVIFRYFPHEQDVEDLAQEVFFKAYRSLEQYEGRSSLKTWLYSIATNTAKNELRKRSRRPVVVDQSLQEMEEVLPDEAEALPKHNIHQQQTFQQAFSQLSAPEQEILLLKDAEELTYEEIAGQLNLSVSAAKMRVQRARLAMKTYYQEKDHVQQSS